VFGSDGGGIDPRARGIYDAGTDVGSGTAVNDGSEIIINFELFHCNQGRVMLSFACLGSNSLADLIDFLHPTFIIGAFAGRTHNSLVDSCVISYRVVSLFPLLYLFQSTLFILFVCFVLHFMAFSFMFSFIRHCAHNASTGTTSDGDFMLRG
jgi:hypothetical protein